MALLDRLVGWACTRARMFCIRESIWWMEARGGGRWD